jgi:uncharacterized protein YndB with AHSA1/START domain
MDETAESGTVIKSPRSVTVFQRRRCSVKWILIVVGVIVLMAGAVTLIGLMLPRDHLASSTASINAPPQNVWDALVNVSEYPRWRPDVRSVDVLSTEGALRWREHTRQGDITLERVEEERPRRLVARIADDKLPFGGTWTYELEPDSQRTRLTITERGYVTNPLFRFMARFVFGHHQTQEDFLRALGRRFGQEVTITRA